MLVIVGVLAIFALSAGTRAVSATTYDTPGIFAPSAISPGGEVPLTLNVTTTTILNQYDCPTSSFLYYNITEISVTTPLNDSYQLGSSDESGFAGSTEGGDAPQIQVAPGDSFTFPYGPETAGYKIVSNVTAGNYTSGQTEGTYYWWRNTVAGVGTPAPGQRLDLYPGSDTGPWSISNPPAPTIEQGTYTIDFEGNVYCTEQGSGGTFQATLHFDLPITVTTPEFPLGLLVATAAGFAGLAVVLKKRSAKILPVLPVNGTAQ